MTGNRLLNIFGVCLLVIVLPWLNSCKTITSFVHDGRVVAKIGNHKLYASDLNAYIPDSASPEDSTRLALQYINSWASDMAFIDVAEKELSKSEKNVDKELEDYRRSLLKYRYEQKYVNQRLDTAVTDAQIENLKPGLRVSRSSILTECPAASSADLIWFIFSMMAAWSSAVL